VWRFPIEAPHWTCGAPGGKAQNFQDGKPMTFPATSSSSSRVRKAVVPAAGLGTRHFPASHAVKKELFPVVGPDGIARALIHYHLLELTAAGIEQICIIVQPGDDKPIREYLAGPGDAYLKRLEKYPALLAQVRTMHDLSQRVCFATQHEQDGYGHAIYQTKSFAADEMVLLCLGDHLFRGKPVSPFLELANMAATSAGKSVSAVNRIGPTELKGFGTIAGKRRADNTRLIDVSLIIEKPDVATARKSLRVDGLEPDVFLGWFGMHLLAPSIYDVLEEMIHAERFDFGIPDDFVKSVQQFRQG
jgi:UTP--glucose-1-phosphate uridylyltransferase